MRYDRDWLHGDDGEAVEGIKDQHVLSLKNKLTLFVISTERLAVWVRTGEDSIAFDDDNMPNIVITTISRTSTLVKDIIIITAHWFSRDV